MWWYKFIKYLFLLRTQVSSKKEEKKSEKSDKESKEVTKKQEAKDEKTEAKSGSGQASSKKDDKKRGSMYLFWILGYILERLFKQVCKGNVSTIAQFQTFWYIDFMSFVLEKLV